jgi:thiaminase/transcriptional activator TenA
MKLSELAWKKSYPIYQKIIAHPFNQELMNGTLALNKFAYYLEQDSVYTPAEVRLEAIIASKITYKYIKNILKYSGEALIYEQEIEHYFKTNTDLNKTGNLTQATLNYVEHLQSSGAVNAEVGVASILPCFWFYREEGKYFAQNSSPDNPYSKWIESYSSDNFSEDTDNIIDIFDDLANNATPEIQSKMLDIFYQSAIHEWHFFDDSYAMRVYDEF